MNHYHILNGDALADVFPAQLAGERIVARECLVDGDVHGETVEQLYATRSAFMCKYGEAYQPGDYEKKSIPEFERIRMIPENSEINLWFEDDLFCQVNLWFVLHVLCEKDQEQSIYLVRPSASIEFGFGGMSPEELVKAFEARVKIPASDLFHLKILWRHYQKDDFEKLLLLAKDFNQRYPFLFPAVMAHVERMETANGTETPERIIREIINELNTNDFGKVFREFCKRKPIYGFGDLQVERMWRQIIDNP